MTDIPMENDALSSLKTHSFVGAFAVVGVFGGFLLWASTFDISGAVVASGTMVVESHAKSIQHRDGGIIKQILVKDEDAVAKGQLLALLDDTDISANHTVIQTQLNQALAKEARLLAEVTNAEVLSLNSRNGQPADAEQFTQFLKTEQQVFVARKATRERRIAQISEQIIQIERQIDGLELQRRAVERQLHILNKELGSLSALFKNKLIEARRVTNLEKEIAFKEGELGRLLSAKAEARASIAEKGLLIEQIRDDFLTGVLDDLQTTRQQITTGLQQRRASADKIDRSALRAPSAGVVHQSKIHTIGGVISPGETLMLLVPQDDALAIDIKINPIDIDKTFVGQEVVIRLSSLDQRKTPEITGMISQIAPDVSLDPITREQYFGVRITISKGEFDRLPKSIKLLPGMPVEAFIKTEERNVLSYLIHPFKEQLKRALRED